MMLGSMINCWRAWFMICLNIRYWHSRVACNTWCGGQWLIVDVLSLWFVWILENDVAHDIGFIAQHFYIWSMILWIWQSEVPAVRMNAAHDLAPVITFFVALQLVIVGFIWSWHYTSIFLCKQYYPVDLCSKCAVHFMWGSKLILKYCVGGHHASEGKSVLYPKLLWS